MPYYQVAKFSRSTSRHIQWGPVFVEKKKRNTGETHDLLWNLAKKMLNDLYAHLLKLNGGFSATYSPNTNFL